MGKTTRNIYLVRHGQDPEGYRGGWSQLGLMPEGVKQVRRLAGFLVEHKHAYPVDMVVSSDLRRAAETSEILQAALGVPVTFIEAWREMNNGELAGMPHAEAEKRYPGIYSGTLGWDQSYPGGESPQQFFERIKRAFDTLCANTDVNVLVSTHGGVIGIVYSLIQQTEWSNKLPVLQTHPVEHASLHRIECLDGKWQFTEENLVVKR